MRVVFRPTQLFGYNRRFYVCSLLTTIYFTDYFVIGNKDTHSEKNLPNEEKNDRVIERRAISFARNLRTGTVCTMFFVAGKVKTDVLSGSERAQEIRGIIFLEK